MHVCMCVCAQKVPQENRYKQNATGRIQVTENCFMTNIRLQMTHLKCERLLNSFSHLFFQSMYILHVSQHSPIYTEMSKSPWISR